MFRAGLLLIIRRYYSVYTAVGMSCVYDDSLLAGSGWNSIPILPIAGQHKHMTYTKCCIYRVRIVRSSHHILLAARHPWMHDKLMNAAGTEITS